MAHVSMRSLSSGAITTSDRFMPSSTVSRNITPRVSTICGAPRTVSALGRCLGLVQAKQKSPLIATIYTVLRVLRMVSLYVPLCNVGNHAGRNISPFSLSRGRLTGYYEWIWRRRTSPEGCRRERCSQSSGRGKLVVQVYVCRIKFISVTKTQVARQYMAGVIRT